MTEIGGSMGPIYGTFFIQMSLKSKDTRSCKPSHGALRVAYKQKFDLKERSSRWKINETGRTLRSRRTARRLSFLFRSKLLPESQEPEDQLPSTVDPRHRTLFGAAWTLGTLSRLLPLDHVENLTFYETTGWRGLMETEKGSAYFRQFGSTPGEIFPVYYVFAALAGAQRLLSVTVSDPRRIAALAFSEEDGRSTCLLANLTSGVQTIKLDCLASGLRISGIDEGDLPGAGGGRSPAWHPLVTGQERLALSPNALVKLEFP